MEHRASTGHALYCHADFTDAVLGSSNRDLRRRATLVLRHLAAHGRTGITKATKGKANRGWRRTPLGGRGGSQYYAWWVPHHAPPVEHFAAPEGSIFVRAMRHHDDHSSLDPSRLDDYYTLNVADLENEIDHPAPWTPEQDSFALSDRPIRVLIGHPGAGKTEALWRAVDLRGGDNVLYITWSRRLTELATEHFATFAPANTEVETWAMADLLSTIVEPPVAGSFESQRERFLADTARRPAATLGPWTKDPESLFAEIRAHLVGAALPDQPTQLESSDRTRLRGPSYRQRRSRKLGGQATRAVLDVVDALASNPVELYFPDLLHAARAARELLRTRRWPPSLIPPDRIVLDEVQDLTPVEALVPALLANIATRDGVRPRFLCAGDEGQTVRPTDFEWGWFKDMLASRVGRPESISLTTNLRSPRRIGLLINRVASLYGRVPKSVRPRGVAGARISDVINDTIIHCEADAGADSIAETLEALAARPGTALIRLSRAAAENAPVPSREALLSPAQAKGREFQIVCILDPGRWLDEIAAGSTGKDRKLALLRKRTAIDRFRVSVSRATETLVFLDLDSAAAATTRDFLREFDPLPMTSDDLLFLLRAPSSEPEELVRACIDDARASIDTDPKRAWRLVQQAVRRLGDPGRAEGVSDDALRREAHCARARIALGIVGSEADVGLAVGELMIEAKESAKEAGSDKSADVLRALVKWQRSSDSNKPKSLLDLAGSIEAAAPLEPWLASTLQRLRGDWARDLSRGIDSPDTAEAICRSLLTAAGTLGLHEMSAPGQIATLRERAIEVLLNAGRFEPASNLLSLLEQRPPKLEARVLIGLGRFGEAASLLEEVGELAMALDAYRRVPDLDAAIRIAKRTGTDIEALEWLEELRDLMARRPTKLRLQLNESETSWLKKTLSLLE
ncbi:MAG: hypothetical protein CME06_02270 [Gemmatimonadetes bacterium]|nr:hypothetical protein [Gemmatimonadota bacterium]